MIRAYQEQYRTLTNSLKGKGHAERLSTQKYVSSSKTLEKAFCISACKCAEFSLPAVVKKQRKYPTENKARGGRQYSGVLTAKLVYVLRLLPDLPHQYQLSR
jgi:hypothetical protein